MRRFDAVIAGAGAAGMFCAVQLGWRGRALLLSSIAAVRAENS